MGRISRNDYPTPWTLDEIGFAEYENVLNPSMLHFQVAPSPLNCCSMHISCWECSYTRLVDQFWNGDGTTVFLNKYANRKPDLLSL